jgi:hypothetical protein
MKRFERVRLFLGTIAVGTLMGCPVTVFCAVFASLVDQYLRSPDQARSWVVLIAYMGTAYGAPGGLVAGAVAGLAAAIMSLLFGKRLAIAGWIVGGSLGATLGAQVVGFDVLSRLDASLLLWGAACGALVGIIRSAAGAVAADHTRPRARITAFLGTVLTGVALGFVAGGLYGAALPILLHPSGSALPRGALAPVAGIIGAGVGALSGAPAGIVAALVAALARRLDALGWWVGGATGGAVAACLLWWADAATDPWWYGVPVVVGSSSGAILGWCQRRRRRRQEQAIPPAGEPAE